MTRSLLILNHLILYSYIAICMSFTVKLMVIIPCSSLSVLPLKEVQHSSIWLQQLALHGFEQIIVPGVCLNYTIH